MRRQRQGTRSTHTIQPAILNAQLQVDNLHPIEEICVTHNIFCFTALADFTTGTMYTDLPGAFPVCSFKSMQYVFVAYVYDLNAILIRAMPSKNDGAMIDAFTEIIATLAMRNYHPTLNMMDNECSKAVKAHICKSNMDIHLVPPHTIGSTLLSTPSPLSRSTSLQGSPLLTRTVPCNFEMNFYRKSN